MLHCLNGTLRVGVAEFEGFMEDAYLVQFGPKQRRLSESVNHSIHACIIPAKLLALRDLLGSYCVLMELNLSCQLEVLK